MNGDILWFRDLSLEDLPRVGGKNASLGELVRGLAPLGVNVPDGFAVTADAWRRFVAVNDLGGLVSDTLAGLEPGDIDGIRRAGHTLRHAFRAGELPADMAADILEAYAALGSGVDVAVRSSATAEDLPDASFAGQQETYLNVRGGAALLDACVRCFASLFTDRAISYRMDKGYADADIALSVGVQRMVRSDEGAAGVMFTLDTESGNRDMVLISAAWGLGESVVQGSVTPDEFLVFKPTLLQGARPILRRRLGSKEFKLIYDEGGGRGIRGVPVSPEDRDRYAVDDDQLLQLARWGCAIEAHYSERRGVPTPMDIEWALDGLTGELFIVQARPETVRSQESGVTQRRWELEGRSRVLAAGRSVGDRIGSGVVRVVRDASELWRVKPGEVLVTERTDPDWEPVMRSAAAIVTERGGRTCHAAIVSRELGIPAVVGVAGATKALREGQMVTVSCAEGDVGRVYEGALPFRVEEVALHRPETRTKIMVNVGDPDTALRVSSLPVDGVGLARLEFLIGGVVGVHPMALINFKRLEPGLQARIAEAARGSTPGPDWFVEKLSEGVGVIAGAFYPRPVIVRLGDFKSNEYADLIGGEAYEPKEENPMLGWRGASRYVHPDFREAFALECRALLRVRRELGLTNVKLMVPFCRTVEEGRRVIAALAENGLVQGEDGLEVYVMCEIPSNAILIEQFAEVFDGFSIGSNDLTQLTLGVDRDSEMLAPLFDERDPAVKAIITMAVDGARRAGKPIGICGQAPSDFPEFARFLVEAGVTSISLTPDVAVRTAGIVAEVEAGGLSQPSSDQPAGG